MDFVIGGVRWAFEDYVIFRHCLKAVATISVFAILAIQTLPGLEVLALKKFCRTMLNQFTLDIIKLISDLAGDSEEPGFPCFSRDTTCYTSDNHLTVCTG